MNLLAGHLRWWRGPRLCAENDGAWNLLTLLTADLHDSNLQVGSRGFQGATKKMACHQERELPSPHWWTDL